MTETTRVAQSMNDVPAAGVYLPGEGVVAALGGHQQTDSDGTLSAALINEPLPSSTATLSVVTAATTTTVLLPANPNRLGVLVMNDTTIGNLYLAYAGTASTTVYTIKLAPGASWVMPAPMYLGTISGIWDGTPSGAARLTELS